MVELGRSFLFYLGELYFLSSRAAIFNCEHCATSVGVVLLSKGRVPGVDEPMTMRFNVLLNGKKRIFLSLVQLQGQVTQFLFVL